MCSMQNTCMVSAACLFDLDSILDSPYAPTLVCLSDLHVKNVQSCFFAFKLNLSSVYKTFFVIIKLYNLQYSEK